MQGHTESQSRAQNLDPPHAMTYFTRQSQGFGMKSVLLVHTLRHPKYYVCCHVNFRLSKDSAFVSSHLLNGVLEKTNHLNLTDSVVNLIC